MNCIIEVIFVASLGSMARHKCDPSDEQISNPLT